MLPRSKISPLIPQITSLDHNFLYKYPKLSRCLLFESIHNKFPHQSQNALLKTFKTLKSTKKIRQKDNFPFPKAQYLIRKVPKNMTIKLEHSQIRASDEPIRLDLWLKYAKSLKNISFLFPAEATKTNRKKYLFQKQIERSLKYFHKQKSLKSFQVKLPTYSKKTVKKFLEFQEYPVSLRSFALYEQTEHDPKFTRYDKAISAFSRLKKLQSLTLIGSKLGRLAENLLEQVPGLSNLKKLNVQVPKQWVKTPLFSLSACQNLKNLRYLKVSNIEECYDLGLLAWAPRLETLGIKGKIGIKGLVKISQLLSSQKNSLRSLKIDINHSYQAQTEERIKELFSRISELKELTCFKFKVKNTAIPFYFKEVNLSSEILENLQGLFSKPVKLESFEWDIPRTSGQNLLLDLLELLEGSYLSLKKLKIFHQFFINLERMQEAKLLNFLKGLESIQVLHLTGFKVVEEYLWVDWVDFLGGLKSLRFLGVEYMDRDSKNSLFLKSLAELVEKKNLKDFCINPYFKPNEGKIGSVEVVRLRY